MSGDDRQNSPSISRQNRPSATPEIMKEIRGSDTLRKLWEKYSREYEYAKDISFDDTCNTIQTIMDAIMV